MCHNVGTKNSFILNKIYLKNSLKGYAFKKKRNDQEYMGQEKVNSLRSSFEAITILYGGILSGQGKCTPECCEVPLNWPRLVWTILLQP